MKLSVAKILEICNGSLICGNDQLEIESFSKDTRTIEKNDCYVGIKGENFNGNLYWKEAKEKGAIACIVEEFKDALNDEENFPIILVENSIKALQDLASYVRSKLDVPVIAITGSAGKTSTKDMIASVLKEKYKVLKTEGNLNGQLGLPLTILKWKDEDVLVLEMGMNDFGQIKALSKIAKPTIAVFTNIGTAHIGVLGSRENILKAKLEMLDGMKENSTIIIGNDNDLLSKVEFENYHVIRCGMKKESEFNGKNLKVEQEKTNYDLTYQNETTNLTIPFLGEVFVNNSLLAIATGITLGLTMDEIKNGLKEVNISKNRMEIIHLKENITLINDTYNANFEATESALKTLVNYPSKRKIAVLGDILEMEKFSEEIHRKIGALDSLKKCDFIFLLGENTVWIQKEAEKNGIEKTKIEHFKKIEELQEKLKNEIKEGDTILLKASHAMKFDQIVAYLKER